MRRLLLSLLLLGSLSTAFAGDVVTGRVVKVLPFFLDLKGHDALSPSLYDRDAYQAYLRRHLDQRSAIRFDVLWKASDVGDAKLKLRVELRGIGSEWNSAPGHARTGSHTSFLPPLELIDTRRRGL